MLLTSSSVHVHDVWDGNLYQELHRMSLGLVLSTTEPGYNRLGLPDYITQYESFAVIINTPILGDVISMARKATKLPTLYVASRRLASGATVELLPTERVLWREDMTGFAVIGALHDCLAGLPVHS